MESVIAMSQLEGKTRFERSSLPTKAQLDLHVDGQDFRALVQQLQLKGEVLEKLARAAHEVFCAALEKDGWKFGPEKNDKTMEHPFLKDFSLLPEASSMFERASRKIHICSRSRWNARIFAQNAPCC